MKKLLLFLIPGLIMLSSCDGRSSQNKSLNEHIAIFKKQAAFEIPVFKPESPFLREIDTLLHNGFRVKIKTFTDTENQVTYTKTIDTITRKTNYRNFIFDIRVEKEGEPIYTNRFDKLKANVLFNFNNHLNKDASLFNFDKSAVLESIHINDEPLLKNRVQIDFTYAIPETNRYVEKILVIYQDGTTKIVDTKVK